MIGHAGDPAVHIGAAQIFSTDDFAGGSFYQRRPGQEDGALFLDDDGFVGHGWHVCAAGSAQPHNHRDLWDVVGGHAGLIIEDAAEVVPVREDFVLAGQVSAAGVH